MKFLFDLFPVILFFVAFKFAGIYAATAVAMAATVGQIAWVWFRHRKVEPMLWVSFGVIAVFGSATLLLQDKTFIQWKPTVLYWIFGASLAIAHVFFRRNLIQAMMGKQIQLPDPVWSKLLWSWVAFFIAMGMANLYVAYNFSEDTWVNFKLFGGMGLMFAFVIGQAVYLARFTPDETPGADAPEAKKP